MAKLKVTYTALVEEVIDWPDDEIDDLNYENLLCNLDPEASVSTIVVDEVHKVLKDGEYFEF